MAKDWTPVHNEIRRLYQDEGEPLHEVMRLVRGKLGFIALERAYRTQLKAWGYTKYSTEASSKPVKKKAKSTHQLPQSARVFYAIPATSQNEEEHISGRILSDFSPFTGEEVLFDTPANSTSSVSLPSYNNFSISQSFAPHTQRIDGKTPLHDAVIQKNFDSVKRLLFSGHAVDIKDNTGNSPLHYAVLVDDYGIIKLLLEFGADVNAKGQLGRSALHFAVTIVAGQTPDTVSTQVLDFLMRHAAEATSQDDKGDTPLHLALLGNLNESLDHSTDNYGVPKTPPVIERLLKANIDLKIRNAIGMTPFLKLLGVSLPSSIGNFNLIRLFLEAGASATLALRDGRTPLSLFLRSHSKIWAASGLYGTFLERDTRRACHRALRHLLDAGASIATRTSSGQSMVVDYFRNYYARGEVDVTLAEKLCDLCPANLILEGGNTILHELAANQKPSSGKRTAKHCRTVGLIDIVMTKGANVNQQNERGETPLMTIFIGREGVNNDSSLAEQVMSALLRHGADPRVRDERNRHIVLEAANKFPEAAEAFLGPLFRAYMSSMMVNEDLDLGNSGTPAPTAELAWLSELESAVRRQSWEAARTQLAEHLAADGADPGTGAVRIAYTVVAEHLVQVFTKRNRDGDLEKNKARSQVSDILRTCRERNLPVDLKAYECLLELC